MWDYILFFFAVWTINIAPAIEVLPVIIIAERVHNIERRATRIRINKVIHLTIKETKLCYKIWRETPHATPDYVFVSFGFTLGEFCIGQVLKR